MFLMFAEDHCYSRYSGSDTSPEDDKVLQCCQFIFVSLHLCSVCAFCTGLSSMERTRREDLLHRVFVIFACFV